MEILKPKINDAVGVRNLFKDLASLLSLHLKEMCGGTSEIVIKVSLCTINIIVSIFMKKATGHNKIINKHQHE